MTDNSSNAPTASSTNLATPNPSPSNNPPVALVSRLLVGGNIFWGRHMNDWAQASQLGYEYPFSKLNTLHRERYDAWITGLECPTKPGINPSAAEQETILSFNCSPKYLPAAARWFTAFTLANNHTDNQGEEGFATTKQELSKVGIQYFGHYDPNRLDDLCNVITVPATVTYTNDAVTPPASAAKRAANAELPLIMCGYHGVFQIPSPESLGVVARYADMMPVIALPHMGAEYQAEPDQIKTDTYRKLIDNGADMVLGDHPHWVQRAEVYHNKLIAYAMGNFMFDQQTDLERTRSAAMDITARATDPQAISGWTEIASQCRQNGPDQCVELAKQRGLPRLTLNYEFKVVGTRDDQHLTRRANKTELAAIKQRLGWSDVTRKLNH
ncbi:MAG: CapA family protein [Bifidobacteriaceae bacterium]|nr:CapA family protein [Bifidobacteriaceae bacterium]